MTEEILYTGIIMASGLICGSVFYFLLEKYEWNRHMRELKRKVDEKTLSMYSDD